MQRVSIIRVTCWILLVGVSGSRAAHVLRAHAPGMNMCGACCGHMPLIVLVPMLQVLGRCQVVVGRLSSAWAGHVLCIFFVVML